jgi:hypothetical protein
LNVGNALLAAPGNARAIWKHRDWRIGASRQQSVAAALQAVESRKRIPRLPGSVSLSKLAFLLQSRWRVVAE